MRLHAFGSALLACTVLAGCGGDGESPPRAPVSVVIEGAKRQAGPPDAGTATGHGADLVVTAYADEHSVRGRVRPAASRILLRPGRGAPVRALVDDAGRFRASLERLRMGASDWRVKATSPGRRSWERALRIVRRPLPARIRVPDADPSPPEVALQIVGARAKVVADSQGRLAPDLAHLPRVEARGPLRALALGRDADGGLGRVRVSIVEVVECRRSADAESAASASGEPAATSESAESAAAAGSGRIRRVRAVRYIPPPAIERIRLTPGTSAPTTRRRDVVVGARPGVCRDGERALGARLNVWAEATNAHGLEAVSTHLHVRQRR